MAETLRRAVRESGLSVAAVARAAGIPQPVLQRFMAETRGLTLETADKLARVVGLVLTPSGSNGHAVS